MMLSKTDSRRKAGWSSGNENLLNDIERISKAIYADKKLQRLTSSTASSRSKSVEKSHLADAKMKPKEGKNNANDLLDKDKKTSIWSWKGLKALSHVRSRRFNCCFSLLVHYIEGLPASFGGARLVVHWRRRDGEQMTRPVRVSQGVAQFEERLAHSCSVYGSRSGPHNLAKYEAKHFLLYVSVYDDPQLDLGRHRIDLTRLLPLTLEELEESSGKWTTSFKLSGKARGAMLNVSFGYVASENSSIDCSNVNPDISSFPQSSRSTSNLMAPSDQLDELRIHRAGSLPSRSSASNRSAEDIKDLHEVLPVSRSELCDSVNILYQKLDEEMADASGENKLEADLIPSAVDHYQAETSVPLDAGDKDAGVECEITGFSVVDKGIEEMTKEHVKQEDEPSKITQGSGDVEASIAVEATLDEDACLHSSAVEIVSQDDEKSKYKGQENEMPSKESVLEELEAALSSSSYLTREALDSLEDDSDALNIESHLEFDSDSRHHRKGKSISLDDVTDSVASDFLEMLGIDHSPFGLSSESEPESPRERLLRQFEKDALANGGLLNFDMDNDPADDIIKGSIWGPISEDSHHSLSYEAFKEIHGIDTDTLMDKTRASKMEDLETEALMREWGLNEKAFQHSPPGSGGFGSPISTPPEDPQQLPPLAEGLGPCVETKNGGFLRSMSPALFRNAKSGGSLIMQVSNPVVVPAEMGSGVMDILQGLASVGIEKLSMQANKLMPLEDVTGKTIQQIAWESAPRLEEPPRLDLLHQKSEIEPNLPSEQKSVEGISPVPKSSKLDSRSLNNDTEYVSLEDLAPLAMDKIEALSIEGLRIQSGMSDEDAPSNISTQSIGELSALKGKTVGAGETIGLDGTCGLQLLDIKDNGEDIDGLMSLSLTLDEWMKLDSGDIGDDDLISERTSKILAAHHATSLELFRGRSKGEKRRGRRRKFGLLGNNFTVALMVQLRDPLRNYEPVGTPMLALIQVERVFVPPKPKMYSTVSLVSNNGEDEEELKAAEKDKIKERPEEEKIHEEELIPQYKVTEVHVAGLKAEAGKKKLWGSTSQQQSGSRWLLANGMGKKNKHPLMKSKPVKSSGAGSLSAPMTRKAHPGDTLWSISS